MNQNFKYEFPFCPAIPLLAIYPTGTSTHLHKDICTRIASAAFFFFLVIVKYKNQLKNS